MDLIVILKRCNLCKLGTNFTIFKLYKGNYFLVVQLDE